MYVPEPFALDDPARVAEVIRGFSFALLVSARDGQAPVATHLPILHDPEAGTNGTLLGHVARANPHWRDLEALGAAGGEVMVVFAGPQAYVSPSWYAPGPAVPTWNYVAVHAYGVPRLIDDPVRGRALLDRLVATYEAGSPAPWSTATQDEKYLDRMRRGIVAFEIPIARIESKAKLSQNRDVGDRRRVVQALRAAGDEGADALAEWMEAVALSA